MSKITIYQLFPRYFSNNTLKNIPNGTIEENGVGKLEDINDNALLSIKNAGITHIWLTGVIEHATKTGYEKYGISPDHPSVVKGNGGSPYAIKDYYDIDPDLAKNPDRRIEEFDSLVTRCHHNGFKVIIDFVPNHLARKYHSDIACENQDFGFNDNDKVAFSPDNNFYYLPGEEFSPDFGLKNEQDDEYHEFPAKATGNDCFTSSPSKNDWYDTVKLNYGIDYRDGSRHLEKIPDTWRKMLDVISYWINKGIDGFRCDMVEMVPVEFWHWAVSRAKKINKDIVFIAEIYNPEKYESYVNYGGFDYLYDKVGMYDAVRSIIEGKSYAGDITFVWQSTGSVLPHMLYFLENHDEQRIASSFFAGDPVKAIPGMIVMACLQTNPVMIYSGQELGEQGMYSEGFSGEDGRSSIFDYWSVESLCLYNNGGLWDGCGLSAGQKNLKDFYSKVLSISLNNKAISDGLFFDLMYVNRDNKECDIRYIYSFLRKKDNELIFVAVNFGKDDKTVSVNIPGHAFDYLDIADSGTRQFTDLLTGRKLILTFSSLEKLTLQIPAYGGVILKNIS